MNKEVMFSSKKDDWATPMSFFKELDDEFHFTLDPCCYPQTAKCRKYYTKETDGLKQSWRGETVFCNPPYGRDMPKWIEKCYLAARDENATCVMLIPSRTDTAAFHDYILPHAEMRFVRGRLKFEQNGEPLDPAPFPSLVAVFRPPALEPLTTKEWLQWHKPELIHAGMVAAAGAIIFCGIVAAGKAIKGAGKRAKAQMDAYRADWRAANVVSED